MKIIVYSFFISLFVIDYLVDDVGILPKKASFYFEIASMLTALYICLVFAIKKKLNLRISYVIVFILTILHYFSGIIINQVPAKEILLGVRTYFKFFPFFLFPIVFILDENDIKTQLKLLLGLLLLQCPITIYQRFVQHKTFYTGDVIYGTVMSSGRLTIMLICAISILYSFYLKKKITLKFFLLTAFILFIPTTINETKITLFILPLGLFIPAIFHKGFHASTIKNVAVMSLAGIMLFYVFVSAYEYTMSKKNNYIRVDKLISDETQIERYFFRKNKPREDGNVGRGSAIYFAVKETGKKISTFATGKGIGTVQKSNFKKQKEIEFHRQRGAEKMTSTMHLWETGLFGTLLFFSIFILALRDSYFLSKEESIFGHLAFAWIAVVTIIGITAITYTNFYFKPSLFALFWFFTGVIASRRYERGQYNNAT